MSRTRTASWDMNRWPMGEPAPLNDTCPKCGKPCNSTVVVNEKLYFCCGTVKVNISEAAHYQNYLAGKEFDPRD